MPLGTRKGYVVGVAATAAVVLIRLVVSQFTGFDAPIVLFVLAVLAAAWQGGLRPGLATTALALAVILVSFAGRTMAPPDVFRATIRLAAFLPVGILVSVVAARLRRAVEQADARREILRVTVASIGDGVITTDTDGCVRTMNPVAEKLTGWTQEEAKGQRLADVFQVVNEYNREPAKSIVRKVLTENQAVGLGTPSVLVARDKTERYIDDSVAPIVSKDGAVLGAVLVFRDVTDRRRAEQTAAERARLTALRADASSALTGAVSLQAGLQHCAETVVRHLDAALARVWTLTASGDVLELQASAGLYTHPDGPDMRVDVSAQGIGQIAKSRRPHLTNDLQRDPSAGGTWWVARESFVAFAGYPLLLEDRVVGVIAVYSHRPFSDEVRTDLGALAGRIALHVERKAAEEQLRASEERWRLALESAELGAWHIDPATNELTSDERFQRIFGGTVGPISYEEAFALVHPDDRERIHDAVAAAVRPDDPIPFAQEFRVVHPAGAAVRWVFGKGRVNFAAEGANRRTASLDGTVADTTKRREMEDQLRELAARLSEADHRKDVFLATLAHELRNPLAPIRNALQVVRLAAGNADMVSRAREMMERQLQQMVRLIDDLLEVSRISQGKITLRCEPTALAGVVENAVEASLPLVKSLGHELRLEPMPAAVVNADAARLSQVFQNLLNNAAKYSERGGSISVQTRFADGIVTVSVADTGIGIPAFMLPKVFDLFTQVEQSLERSQGGLGIGLSLVKRLVELHGGTVEARSNGPGTGSTFVVRMPAALEPAKIDEPASDKDGTAPQSAHRILIADDNEDSADSLSTLLEIMGNTIRTVYDGLAAVQAAEEFRPDVVLLDIGMPKLNGYEVARRLREKAGGEQLVLIALTGWGQEDDIRRGQEAGFDHHMVKPADTAALMKLLAELPPVVAERGK